MLLELGVQGADEVVDGLEISEWWLRVVLEPGLGPITHERGGDFKAAEIVTDEQNGEWEDKLREIGHLAEYRTPPRHSAQNMLQLREQTVPLDWKSLVEVGELGVRTFLVKCFERGAVVRKL
jgi:hypothetical protein